MNICTIAQKYADQSRICLFHRLIEQELTDGVLLVIKGMTSGLMETFSELIIIFYTLRCIFLMV
ncbi:hypothetical protein [Desertivirga brevis]|uniref:hypothetical protein n=1 Tax=Desertivirga brevis TaxID=2810310 RepID=UPI001A95FCAB|nr:hypothetical protein [Pedobacter sp. SYSU D00873]